MFNCTKRDENLLTYAHFEIKKWRKLNFYNLPFDTEMSLHPGSPRQKAEQSCRTSFAYKYIVEAIKGREGNPSLPGALTGRHDGGHQQ